MSKAKNIISFVALCGLLLAASACSDPWVTVHLTGPWPAQLHVSVMYEDGAREAGTPFDVEPQNGVFSFHVPREDGTVRLTITELADFGSRNKCRMKLFSGLIPIEGKRFGKDITLNESDILLQPFDPPRCDCDGKGWCKEQVPMDINYYSITGTSADNVWVGGTGGKYLHLSNHQWKNPFVGGDTIVSIYADIRTVQVVDHNNKFYCGHPGLQPMGGNAGCPSTQAPKFFALAGDSDPRSPTFSKVWVAGEAAALGDVSVIADGNQWRSNFQPGFADPSIQSLLGIWSAGNQEVWAVGVNGTAVNTTQPGIWNNVNTKVKQNLLGIWGSRNNERWAVGAQGTILHWENSQWMQESTEPKVAAAVDLSAVWGSSENDVWTVGKGGVIIHYDGNKWRTQDSPTSQDLHGIWGADKNNVWIVGDGGTVLLKDL